MHAPRPVYAIVFVKKDGKQYVSKEWHKESSIRDEMLKAARTGLKVVGFMRKRAFAYPDMGTALQAIDLLIDESPDTD